MRRISENAFGIIANRWRVFRAPINLDQDKVSMITLAAFTLHNFLLTEPNSEYNTTSNMEKQGKEVSEGSWFDFSPRGSNNYSNEAKVIRDEFKQYFNNEGAVPWQWVQCGLD